MWLMYRIVLSAILCAPTFSLMVDAQNQGRVRSAYAEESGVDARIEAVQLRDQYGPNATRLEGSLGNLGISLANVEVYLFQRGTLNPVSCDFSNQVSLHWAENGTSHVGWPVPGSPRGSGWLFPSDKSWLFRPSGSGLSQVQDAFGVKVVQTRNGVSFPVWEFADVPVASPRVVGGTNSTYFTVNVVGRDYRTNIWVYGYDNRALVPYPFPPLAGVIDTPVDPVDAFIQVVWPHDRQGALQPVSLAPLVNVGVDLASPSDFGNAHWASVGFDFNHSVHLYRALNNGFLEPIPIQPQITATHATIGDVALTWPRYDFDDVDVSATQDPANTYYFAVGIDGVTTHTTIWAHGATPNAFAPQLDVPASSGDGC